MSEVTTQLNFVKFPIIILLASLYFTVCKEIRWKIVLVFFCSSSLASLYFPFHNNKNKRKIFNIPSSLGSILFLHTDLNIFPFYERPDKITLTITRWEGQILKEHQGRKYFLYTILLWPQTHPISSEGWGNWFYRKLLPEFLACCKPFKYRDWQTK